MDLSEIIPGMLAIGPQPHKGLDELSQRGISAILDLNNNDSERQEAEDRFIWKGYLVPDDFEPLPVEALDEAVELLASLIAEGHYVYLHCSLGKGRSPSVAAAYLIRYGKDGKRMSAEAAKRHVKECREVAWEGGDEIYVRNLENFESLASDDNVRLG